MDPKFVLSYDISFQNYSEYNKTLLNLKIGNSDKKINFLSIGLVVLAVVLLVLSVFLLDKIGLFIFSVLLAAISVFGAYYLKIKLPKDLENSLKEEYLKSEENLRNRIISISDGYFTDLPDDGYGEIDWAETKSLVETQNLLLIMFEDDRAIILPKKYLTPEATEFLKEKMVEIGNEVLKV